MSDAVKIIECPRDAWQGLARHIPPDVKAEHLRKLVQAGFRQIDAVSFVSPRAVPQMADSEDVLQRLDLAELDPQNEVEIIGIVVNQRGAERAVATGSVRTLGFPYSISETFLRKNQNQSPEENLDALEAVHRIAGENGLGVVAYVSMAFGNPYGDAWNLEELLQAVENITDVGIGQISLADTVGLASPELVGEALGAAIASFRGVEIGAHLHGRPDHAAAKIASAYQAGCRRFDTALGGLGGCPFAQDALVGNVATELVLRTLDALGARLPKLERMQEALRSNEAIALRFGR